MSFPSVSYSVIIKEVMLDIQEQREEDTSNKDLAFKTAKQAALTRMALISQDSPEQIFDEAIRTAAMALRLAVEGDSTFKKYKYPYN